MRTRRIMPILMAGVVAGTVLPRSAAADGAFPDSQTIMAPSDRPNEIVVGTNFGLVISSDGGTSWLWSCEQAETTNGRLYQMGPAPRDRLFALGRGQSGLPQIVYSDDGACSWRSSGGALSGASVQDLFVDPVGASRVFAIGAVTVDGGALDSVFVSHDAGMTFDQTLYQGEAGEQILGVESARSDSNRIYLTLADATGRPGIARSTDGGATWQRVDLGSVLPNPGQLRLVAVDPSRAARVYLRWVGAPEEELLISDDGGSTVTTALAIPTGTMTSFVRMAAGTILVAALADGALLFRSDDDGATFSSITTPPPPLLRAIAERAGVLYAATDNLDDGFVAAISTDQGSTWQPALTTDGVGGPGVAAIAACVSASCQADCLTRASNHQWAASMCSAAPPLMDAGAPDAHADAASGDGSPGGLGGTRGGRAPGGGCGCAVSGDETTVASTFWMFAAVVWASSEKLRRRRK